jgi:hypothetical protein
MRHCPLKDCEGEVLLLAFGKGETVGVGVVGENDLAAVAFGGFEGQFLGR